MKLLATITSILLSWGTLSAQKITPATHEIGDLLRILPTECLVDRDTILPCPQVSFGKLLVMKYNESHQLAHLGISLFSPSTKEMINLPVCNFLERLLLEIAITKDRNSIKEKLKRNQIRLQWNEADFGTRNFTSIKPLLVELEDPAQFVLNWDSVGYTAIWRYGNTQNVFTITFPASRELVLGTNKKESDELLSKQLQHSKGIKYTPETDVVSPQNLYRTSDPALFIKKGNTFMYPIVNSNIYYKETGKGYTQIYETSYPFESLSNCFLGNRTDYLLKLHINHRMYGNFSPEFEMGLADFVHFFRKEFDIYTAFDKTDTDPVKLTVILQNKQLNYIHMLLIQAPKAFLFQQGGVLSANFYSNIPQHYVKSLFGEFIND